MDVPTLNGYWAAAAEIMEVPAEHHTRLAARWKELALQFVAALAECGGIPELIAAASAEARVTAKIAKRVWYVVAVVEKRSKAVSTTKEAELWAAADAAWAEAESAESGALANAGRATTAATKGTGEGPAAQWDGTATEWAAAAVEWAAASEKRL